MQGIRTEVIRDESAFSALSEDWGRLYKAAVRATPFQTHAWLESWWRAYGRGGRLRVFLVWSKNRLVAAAPLHLVHRGPVRVLVPLGEPVSDFVDILVDETHFSSDDTSRLLCALRDLLRRETDWDVLDLSEVRPAAAATALAEGWPNGFRSTHASTCLELQVVEFQELLSRLTVKRAREVRRVLRRSDELN